MVMTDREDPTAYSRTPLCSAVYPLFAWFVSERSLGMDIVTAVSTFVVVACCSATLALCGLILSVVSWICNALAAIFYGADLSGRRPTPERSDALRASQIPPSTPAKSPSDAPWLSTQSASSEATRVEVSAPSGSIHPSSSRRSSDRKSELSLSPTPTLDSQNSSLSLSAPLNSLTNETNPHRSSPVKRFATAFEQCKRPSLGHKKSPPLSPIASTSKLTEESSTVHGDESPGHGKQRKNWLPRKHHTTPPLPPPPRTDPYQAPYFFPPPGSPQAVDYVRQVRASRTGSSAGAGKVTFEQYYECPAQQASPSPAISRVQSTLPASSASDEVVATTVLSTVVEAEQSSPPPPEAYTKKSLWSPKSRGSRRKLGADKQEETRVVPSADVSPEQHMRMPHRLSLRKPKASASSLSPGRSNEPSTSLQPRTEASAPAEIEAPAVIRRPSWRERLHRRSASLDTQDLGLSRSLSRRKS